jgi:hypothetical protein
MSDIGLAEINGYALSWSSVKFERDGARVYGLTKIGYKVSIDRTMVYGAGRHPRSRTRGRVGYEVTSTWLREALASLRQEKGAGFMDKPFNLHLKYQEASTGVFHETELLGLVMNEYGQDLDNGNSDPLSQDVSLSCMKILEDGVELTEDADQ